MASIVAVWGKSSQERHAHNSLPTIQRGGREPAGLAGLVAIARGKTPDPIPNSAVKTLSADGTAPQGVEE